MQDAGQGIEFSGGHSYGGYHYSVAVVNQNTSGTSASPSNVSSPGGFFSDANFKDIYGRLLTASTWRRTRRAATIFRRPGASGPRDHTYLTLARIYYEGRSVQRFKAGTAGTLLTAREPFYRVGGDFSFNYRTFNLFGLFMYGHDHDLLLNDPADRTGFITGPAANFNGGFLEADYLALPWMMTILRYDRVQSTADFLNQAASGNYFSPVGSHAQPRSRPAYNS